MKRTCAMLALTLLVVAALGCNTLGRQPKLQDATIDPATLKPGDSAVITVKVVDKQHIIDRIVGVVLEDTRMKLPVYDNGVAPDAKAGDGIWSLQVDVPPMALAGQFTLELTAFNSKGEAIEVRKSKHETGPLTATCTWVITAPPEEAAPPAEPAPAEAAPAPEAAPSQG
ncbi:MAG: hypothetical protein IT364_05230 [Candidatus Hydrogenedentes bacterium]|nr:hypothetical protein [Candidatus Hydrogenedentota bacterium]